MKLEKLLTPTELAAFNKMAQQAVKTGAGSVRFYTPQRHLCVIGIFADGRLMTWFATPARTEREALLNQTVVEAGITAIGLAYATQQQVLAAESADMATQVIRKAAQCKMH